MGEVYLAKLKREAGFEKIMAIKRILPTLSDDPEFVSMFNREACIAAQLIHQNIVQIFDYGQHAGAYFIAMEYVHGRDLRTLIEAAAARDQAIPVEVSVSILLSACAALDYAHRQASHDGRQLNIVHRDISPQNILIGYEGAVKLTDFGLAQRIDIDSVRDGQIQGKFAYMSPEQTFGDKLDRRSDIFSLGIVAYELLCGKRPFRSRDLPALMVAIREGVYTPASEVNTALPVAIDAVLARALAIEPADRYPDARAMRAAFEELARAQGWTLDPWRIGELITELCPEQDRPMMADQPGGGTQAAARPIASGPALAESTQAAARPIASSPDNPAARPRPKAWPSGKTQAAARPIHQGTDPNAALSSADTDPAARHEPARAPFDPAQAPPFNPDAVGTVPATPASLSAAALASEITPPPIAPLESVPGASPEGPGRVPLNLILAGAIVLMAGVTAGVIVQNNVSPAASRDAATTWTLNINAEPEGAEVYLDGQRQGTSPLTIRQVAGDRVAELDLRHPGYHNHRQNIDLAWGGGNMVLQPVLKPLPDTGTVNLAVEPPEAFVKFDDEHIAPGPTPGRYSVVRGPGPMRLQVMLDGYEPSIQDIVVPKRSTHSIQVRLQPLPLRVEVGVEDGRKVSGEALITGPGVRTTCRLPCTHSVPTPGEVKVRVTFDGVSEPWTSTQEGKPGQKLVFRAPVPRVAVAREVEPRLTASLNPTSGKRVGLVGASLLKRGEGVNSVRLEDGTTVTLRYRYSPATHQVSFTLGSVPYDSVTLNGAGLGTTPVTQALNPGAYTLRLGERATIFLKFTH